MRRTYLDNPSADPNSLKADNKDSLGRPLPARNQKLTGWTIQPVMDWVSAVFVRYNSGRILHNGQN